MESTLVTSDLAQQRAARKRRHVRGSEPRIVAAIVRRPDRKRRTKRARQRRLNELVRELAHDLGFDLARVSLVERGILHQCATLLLQVELAQDTLVRGDAVIDPDVCIRLSSEARRLLAGLRKRVGPRQAEPPWSPLRARITATAPKAEVAK